MLDEVSKLAHFLKGSSGSLGAHAVRESCRQLQHLGAQQDPETRAALTDADAVVAIGHHLNTYAPVPTPVPHTRTYARIHPPTHARTHARTHTYTHAHTHAPTVCMVGCGAVSGCACACGRRVTSHTLVTVAHTWAQTEGAVRGDESAAAAALPSGGRRGGMTCMRRRVQSEAQARGEREGKLVSARAEVRAGVSV
jgi:hypothetical protein